MVRSAGPLRRDANRVVQKSVLDPRRVTVTGVAKQKSVWLYIYSHGSCFGHALGLVRANAWFRFDTTLNRQADPTVSSAHPPCV